MTDITICVADKKECNKHCRRRTVNPNSYNQSYANFSLDFKKENGNCEAFIGYGKYYQEHQPKIN